MVTIVTGIVCAILGGAAEALFSRMHSRPDGKCLKHKVQGELKGVRLGAAEPNWWCPYGQHYINRRGHEYDRPAEERLTTGLLAAAIAALIFWSRKS